MIRSTIVRALAVVICLAGTGEAATKTIARCGAGFLEEVDGYRVLHLKGSPYAMGFQQGAMLRDDIRENVRYLFDVKAKELKAEIGGIKIEPKRLIASIVERQRKFIPSRFFDEMKGVADGAGMTVEDIIVANFIPELFHCSGFAIGGSATRGGALYHGRILDYGCDWHLQDHAILTVAEPTGRVAFANVTYAGFIGSVTGMNAERISIGEMGGKGLGHWEGIPMAILVRMALEGSKSLDEAVAVFRDNPRTCEYYYVVADGETGRGVGMEASWNRFFTVAMGEAHEKLPTALKDAVVLSAGDRYKELSRRVKDGLGTFDAESARHLMDRPVAMKSNLHSVLFETNTGRLWVANASPTGAPAVTQPYHAFSLPDLLKHTPATDAPTLPCPDAPAPTTTVGAR